MKNEIVQFLKRVCPKYGLSAYYVTDNDVYVVHYKGRAIQNFDTITFFQIPPNARERMFVPLRKVGLYRNWGEAYRQQLLVDRKIGIKIV